MLSIASSMTRHNMLQCISVVLILIISSSSVTAQEKPNIVLINLDDADTNILSDEVLAVRFPNLKKLADRGLRFTNLHATTPLCGPSRACLLRGQYAHNTGVFVNEPKAEVANGMPGGIRHYRDQGFFENDLSTWMKIAGYHTMMVGKFLHGDFVPVLPQGWDNFDCYLGAMYYDFHRMTDELPLGKWTKAEPGVYRTNSETESALKVIQAHADDNSKKPFFLYLNPLAPHNGAKQGMVDTERYGEFWKEVLVPTDESYDEADISDKAGGFEGLPRIPKFFKVYMKNHYRDRLLATLSFDDQLGEIVKKLEELDQLSNTFIFVTSDNGFALGQNRTFGKGYHLDRATRVPLLIAGPGISSGVKNHLLAHIDLAPTIVDIASGKIPSLVDGKSFKQLIDDPNSVSERDWRESILIENWETKSMLGTPLLCASNTMRKYDTVYTEHANGDFEYYDLSQDPMQLNNSYDSLSVIERSALAVQLRSLKADGEMHVGLISPAADSENFSGSVELTGIVDAPAGLAGVSLTLKDAATDKYWDGNEWGTSLQQVAANLGQRTGLLSTWSYDFDPAPDQQPVGAVRLWIKGHDLVGRTSVPAVSSFKLSLSKLPLSEIISPAKFATKPNQCTINGTAVSSKQADHVRLVIRRKEDGKYLNGSEFQSEWTFTSVPVETDGTWSTSMELDAGAYFAITYAVDKSDAREKTPQVHLFFVE